MPFCDRARRAAAAVGAALTLLPAASAPAVVASSAAGCGPVRAQEAFSGRVVGVLDGDSLVVLRDGRQVTVRLHGVDAPESGQAYGNVARRALANLAFGRTVEVEVRDVDRYKRLVSRVTAEGADVGLEMVRAGFAWHYARYLRDEAYAAAEREARAARRGLWQDRSPVAPWEWRANSKHVRPRSGSRRRN